MRYRLRTLLIVLALGPVVLAFIWMCVVIHLHSRPRVYHERNPNFGPRAVMQKSAELTAKSADPAASDR